MPIGNFTGGGTRYFKLVSKHDGDPKAYRGIRSKTGDEGSYYEGRFSDISFKVGSYQGRETFQFTFWFDEGGRDSEGEYRREAINVNGQSTACRQIFCSIAALRPGDVLRLTPYAFRPENAEGDKCVCCCSVRINGEKQLINKTILPEPDQMVNGRGKVIGLDDSAVIEAMRTIAASFTTRQIPEYPQSENSADQEMERINSLADSPLPGPTFAEDDDIGF